MTEIHLNREFEEFYCPVTGEQVLLPDDYLPSPALLFIYVDEFQYFPYAAPEIIENFPQHFDEQGETVNGELLLEKLKKEFYNGCDKLLITYGTCGDARLCFDLGYEKESVLRKL